MRSAIQCAPRAGFRCDRRGVPRLPARCSGPARGPAPARPALGCGDPSLLPRSRCARSKRSPRVAFRPCSAHAADGPRAAAFDRLLMAAIIPPRRAPPALAPGSRTLPQGRLPTVLRSRRRWPASGCIRSLAHGRDHFAASRSAGSRGGLPNAPSRSPSEALRSPSRWAGKICIAAYKSSFLRFAAAMILPCAPAQGEGEPLATARSRRVMSRSLRLAPITREATNRTAGASRGFRLLRRPL